ncbi:hypothetical protein ES703_111521 [subsurface metagenome]
MHIQLEGEVFGGGEGESGRGYPFDGGVVCKIEEHNRPLDSSGFPEVIDKELGGFESNSHCRKDDGEFLALTQNGSLAGKLSGYPVVGQTGTGEYGQFLASDERI